MITVANYNTEKKNIDWSKLPKKVSELRNDVEDIMEFYNDDADIRETVDLFVKKLNENSSGDNGKKKEVVPKNITQFKKWLKSNIGQTLFMVANYRVSKQQKELRNETRTIRKVQSDSVAFEQPTKDTLTWLYYGKSAQWEFTDNFAKWTQVGNYPSVIFYYYSEPKGFKNKHREIINLDENHNQKEKSTATTTKKEPVKKENQKRKSTRTQIANTKYFKKFVPKHQQKALVQVNSWELDSVIERVDQELKPFLEDQQHANTPSKELIVHAHYFYGGSDWFFTNADKAGYLFGYAILNGDTQMSELGYSSLEEIVNHGKVELDFYWKKKTLGAALHEAFPDDFDKPTAGTVKKRSAPKKAPAKKPTKKVENAVNIKEVAHYSKDYTLIRRFYNLVTKKEVVPFRTIRLIFMAFNKAAVERTVRKKDTAAPLFKKVNEKVVKLYDQVKDQNDDAEIDFTDTKLLKEMEAFVKEAKVNPAVRLLKSFISIQGYKPETKRATNLLKRINNALDKDRVTKSNRLYQQVVSAQKALDKYLEKPTQKIEANIYGLSAPRNVCTNRIKCEGLRNDGKLRKGYKFLIDGIVAKTKKPVSKKKTRSTTRKKKVNTKKKKGLGNPLVLDAGKPPYNPVSDLDAAASNRDATAAALGLPVVQPITVRPPAVPVKKSVSAGTRKKNGLVKKMSNIGNTKHEYYRSQGDISRFMGGVEIKPVESIVTTLDAPQGAMKTRLFFQIMNHYASLGYKILFVSLEEHPDSALFKNKRDQYVNPQAQGNIDTVGELPNGVKDFYTMVPDYDFIFVDSWGKLTKNDKKTDLDNDVRKAFDGKWFFIIYQRTTSGSMRGGAASQFDGDMIMKIHKDDEDYKNNYAYWDKNRYEREPNMEYNIFHQRIQTDADAPEINQNGVLML